MRLCGRAFRATIACLSLCLVGCATPSAKIGAKSENFAAVPQRKDATVAVFVNWVDACDAKACRTDRPAEQAAAANCIASGFREAGSQFRAINPEELLRQDTSALVRDPREYGLQDSRLSDELLARLARRGAEFALILDITASIGESRATFKAPVADGGVFIFGKRHDRAVHTRFSGLLVDLSTRRWLARIERIYAGTASMSKGIAMLYILPVPYGYSQSPSAERAACEDLAQSVAGLFGHGPKY